MNPLAVTAGRLNCGAPPAALGLPASLLGQPGGLEGSPNTVRVTAAALRSPEMDSIAAVAGGQAEHSSGLGLSGGGEGGVARHNLVVLRLTE